MDEQQPREQTEERFGDYFLTEPLGAGGMGEVFKAYHKADTERAYPYALKRLRSEDPDLTEGVLREAAIARALRSEYFVETFDVGVVDGDPYLLMEYIDGADLGRVIGRLRRRKRQMPLEVLLDLFEQMATGVVQAHRHLPRGATEYSPVVHRDLKPSNLLIRYDGQVKIADFGIARRLDIDEDDTEERPGTLAYMAPEQLDPDARRPVSPASDVFALGVIGYELCALEPLFEGSEQYIMQQITDPDPLVGPRLKGIGELHPELRRILAKCLRWDPQERYPDAGDLREDLTNLRKRLGFRQGVIASYMTGFRDVSASEALVVLTAGRKDKPPELPNFGERMPITGRHAEVIEFSAKRRLPAKERRRLQENARKRRTREIIFFVVLILALWGGGAAVIAAAKSTVLHFEADPGALVSVSKKCNRVYHPVQPAPVDVHHTGPLPICALFERKGYMPLEMEITPKMAEAKEIIAKLIPEVCVEVSTDPPGKPVRVAHKWQPGSTGTQSEPLRICGLEPGVPYLVQVKHRGEIWDVERFVGDPGDVVGVYRNFVPSVQVPKDPSEECRRGYEQNRLEEALGYCKVAVAEGANYLERLEAHRTQARIYRLLGEPEESCNAFLFALDESVRARDRRMESELLYEARETGCEVP